MSSEGLLDLMEAFLVKFPEIKIIRVVCRILKNLFSSAKIHSILIRRSRLFDLLLSFAKKDYKDEPFTNLLDSILCKMQKLKSSNFTLFTLFWKIFDKNKARLTLRLLRTKCFRGL